MSLTVAEVISSLERLAPPSWAEAGDRVGLQLGRSAQEVTSVLVAMDVTRGALTEARRLGAEMIVAHHPVIWAPLAEIRTDTPRGGLIAGLLRAEIAVYVAHTNLDCAPRVGPASLLADRLELLDCCPLIPAVGRAQMKLVTFLPAENVPAVRQALAEAGAGVIGAYRECSFQVAGEGHFRAPAEAQPAVGEPGEANLAPEARLEMVLPAGAEDAVVQALRRTHPYEEPAFDLYPLAAVPSEAGWGRIGRLGEALPAADLARRVGKTLGVVQVTVAGEGRLETVAVLPGSGRAGVEPALAGGAQALVTGELGYHDTAEATAAGLVVIAAGHAESESLLLPALAEALAEEFGEALQVTVAPVEPTSHALAV
jgi:dinuclear metal center YbgI/SA1388 family protein